MNKLTRIGIVLRRELGGLHFSLGLDFFQASVNIILEERWRFAEVGGQIRLWVMQLKFVQFHQTLKNIQQ